MFISIHNQGFGGVIFISNRNNRKGQREVMFYNLLFVALLYFLSWTNLLKYAMDY